MPELIEAVPADIHFLVDISLKEATHLKHILDHTILQIDQTDEELVAARKFLLDDFVPFINNLVRSDDS